MKKLLYLICLITISSCDDKFDGLQGGVFEGDNTKVTFSNNKAYFSYIFPKKTSYSLSFMMLESNSKILQEFNSLFKKYNFKMASAFNFESTFTYHFVNSQVEEILHSMGLDFDSTYMAEELMMSDHPLNPTGFKIYGSFKGLPLTYKSVEKKYINKSDEIDKSLIEDLLKKHKFKVNNETLFKSFDKGEKLTFVFDYKKVGQNQVLLNKSSSIPNYPDYEDLKNELEVLISKYDNIGYTFNSKTILNFFSDIQNIENNYLKSNYYLNRDEDGYTLKNLEHYFSYTEVR